MKTQCEILWPYSVVIHGYLPGWLMLCHGDLCYVTRTEPARGRGVLHRYSWVTACLLWHILFRKIWQWDLIILESGLIVCPDVLPSGILGLLCVHDEGGNVEDVPYNIGSMWMLSDSISSRVSVSQVAVPILPCISLVVSVSVHISSGICTCVIITSKHCLPFKHSLVCSTKVLRWL